MPLISSPMTEGRTTLGNSAAIRYDFNQPQRPDMTQMTFYPLGNADTSLIELRDGRRILVDYANKRTDEMGDKRCDLPKLLEDDLKAAKRSDYSDVAFTHLDDDHCLRASEFFHFEWAAAYQGPGRHKIETLWVPAGAITEEGVESDARVIRQEARHRLKNGKGIVVFSRPERLHDWLKERGLTVESRKDCFVDAGKLVPGFSLDLDGVEFFAHSPYAVRTNERGVEDRNSDSIMFQARFEESGTRTDALFTGDVDNEVLAEIVNITRHHERDDRLHWNVYHLPHHCSYTAIGPEKGKDKTTPVEQVRWLCETQGEPKSYIVSPSKPIPEKGTNEDKDVQPPHRQAANYYKEDVLAEPRNLLVTMSEPTAVTPKPIVIAINGDGAVKLPSGSGGIRAAASVVAPRAG